MKNIESVVKSNLCIGCGFCTFGDNYKMKYSELKGQYIPVKIREEGHFEYQICPGKGYEIKKESDHLFYVESHYSIDLGYVNQQYVVSSLSEEVLRNASSGGIMTQIILFLLEKGIVERVVVTTFISSNDGIRTKTFFTNSIEDILKAQGSKYCPVNMDSFIKELDEYKHQKFVFVGTPCQIAALREIQKIDIAVKENLILTIGNFCGGFKNYNNISKIAKRHGVDYKKLEYFRFRGGGQPGSLLMRDKNKKSYQIEYPTYTGYTGYSKLLRCHLCVDATAELADIACGDAWLDHYLIDEKTRSVLICRSKFSSKIVEEMILSHKIEAHDICSEEIVHSQRQNIRSKKYRYISRNKLYKRLGYKLPLFDGGYNETDFSFSTEFKIYIFHKFKELIEEVGLYKYFRIMIGKKY